MPRMQTDSLTTGAMARAISAITQLSESRGDIHQATKDPLHCIGPIWARASLRRMQSQCQLRSADEGWQIAPVINSRTGLKKNSLCGALHQLLGSTDRQGRIVMR